MGKVIGEIFVFFNLLPLLHSVFTIQEFRDYEFRNSKFLWLIYLVFLVSTISMISLVALEIFVIFLFKYLYFVL